MEKKNAQPCCEKFKTTIGGQALIEGIMMRGPEKDAIAVRTADGIQLELKERKVRPKGSVATWPLIRGAVNFFDSQVVGVKALMHSADLSPEESQEEASKFDQWLEKKLGVCHIRQKGTTIYLRGVQDMEKITAWVDANFPRERKAPPKPRKRK